MKVFVDTGFLLGFYNPRDQYHSQVISLIKRTGFRRDAFVLTDYIYDEVMIGLLRSDVKLGYDRALIFDREIFERKNYEFIKVSEGLFHNAREIFRRFNRDKEWSFTDCVSYVVMRDMGIGNVLTFDHHFKEMGFATNI